MQLKGIHSLFAQVIIQTTNKFCYVKIFILYKAEATHFFVVHFIYKYIYIPSIFKDKKWLNSNLSDFLEPYVANKKQREKDTIDPIIWINLFNIKKKKRKIK